MIEDEARAWVGARYGPGAITRMERILEIVTAETRHQNLIAASTIKEGWVRHIVDSAQLLDLVKPSDPDSLWLDIGSGAGFPGLVVAALSERPVWLVEPRRRRAEFLTSAVESLGLGARVRVVADKVQNVSGVAADVVSARAVAPLADLFSWATGCSGLKTRWVIPKGRTAREDMASAYKTWHGVFHVEHSITDPASLIVLASGVARR